ncbi:hypothetical protein ACFL5O_12325 [Myxococcota bacterium]
MKQSRLLNHWDRLDGAVARGDPGQFLWERENAPDVVSPQCRNHARQCLRRLQRRRTDPPERRFRTITV